MYRSIFGEVVVKRNGDCNVGEGRGESPNCYTICELNEFDEYGSESEFLNETSDRKYEL